VGRVEFLDHDGKPAARYFVNVAGCGVDADIVNIANKSSKMLGGKLSFMLASLRGLAGWSDVSVRATFDERPPEDLMVTSFSVANGKYFGGGMMVAPDARLDDGLFHITIWSGFSFNTFVLKSGVLYDGSHIKLAGTRIESAKKIRLEPGPKAGKIGLIELDGEPVGAINQERARWLMIEGRPQQLFSSTVRATRRRSGHRRSHRRGSPRSRSAS